MEGDITTYTVGGMEAGCISGYDTLYRAEGQTIFAICGGISIVGGTGAVVVKVIKPAFRRSLETMQKQQSKSLAALFERAMQHALKKVP